MRIESPVKYHNEAALADPQIGDTWQERYSFWLFVVNRIGDKVFTIEGSAPIEFPREGRAIIRTVDEFRKYLSYNTPNMSHKQWCDCSKRGNDVDGWFDERFELTYGVRNQSLEVAK